MAKLTQEMKDLIAAQQCFVTCDNQLIKYAMRLNIEVRVMNPIDYIDG